MKKALFVVAMVATCISFSSCSKASRAASAYKACDKEENLLKKAGCKQEVLKDNAENLKDEKFRKEFWDNIK